MDHLTVSVGLAVGFAWGLSRSVARYWLELQSAEGLTRAGGSTSKVAYSRIWCWLLAGGLPSFLHVWVS